MPGSCAGYCICTDPCTTTRTVDFPGSVGKGAASLLYAFASTMRMRGSDHRPLTIAEKNRQTIGGHYRADITRPPRVRRIAPADIWPIIDVDRNRSMDLRQPERFARQSAAQQRAIRRDGIRGIADMITKVEAVPRCPTDAAHARRLQGADVRRNAPVRNVTFIHCAEFPATSACPPAAAPPTAEAVASTDEPARGGWHAGPAGETAEPGDRPCRKPDRRPADA